MRPSVRRIRGEPLDPPRSPGPVLVGRVTVQAAFEVEPCEMTLDGERHRERALAVDGRGAAGRSIRAHEVDGVSGRAREVRRRHQELAVGRA